MSDKPRTMRRKVSYPWVKRVFSRYESRLAALFAVLAAVPAVLLVIFSTLFFQLGVQSWFAAPVKNAVMGASAVAQGYLAEHRKVIEADVAALTYDLDRQAGLLYGESAALSQFMETQAFLRNFAEVVIFDADLRARAHGGVGMSFDAENVPPGALQSAALGDVVIYTQESEDEKIQAIMAVPGLQDMFVYAARAVDPVVVSAVTSTRNAADNYARLETAREHMQWQFFALYLAVTSLLLAAAMAAGLYVARQLVRPVDHLIAAADAVRAGNLSIQVGEDQGVDEFNELARTFNRMIADLSTQRRDLVVANHELDSRRKFTETVLSGVSTGVMAVDTDGRVRLVNGPGAVILGRPHEQIIGMNVRDLLPTWHGHTDGAAHELDLNRPDHQHRVLLMRVARGSADEGPGGMILTFDDITDLQSAQRKSAWADVARRVAHEIKNPLTPIQLSAERLRRRFGKQIAPDDQAVFQQCLDTIIRHVGDIGRMVAEFARFARLPEANLAPDDLATVTRAVVALHQNNTTGIQVDRGGLLAEQGPCPVRVDAGQLTQALTNLILNALESVEMRLRDAPHPAGLVRVFLERAQGQYLLSILDNGLGFPKGVGIERLSEPYVTFKEKGTGLGLAIVKKIVADHKGSVILGGATGVRDRAGWDVGGAVVTLVLPIPLEQAADFSENRPHAA